MDQLKNRNVFPYHVLRDLFAIWCLRQHCKDQYLLVLVHTLQQYVLLARVLDRVFKNIKSKRLSIPCFNRSICYLVSQATLQRPIFTGTRIPGIYYSSTFFWYVIFNRVFNSSTSQDLIECPMGSRARCRELHSPCVPS